MIFLFPMAIAFGQDDTSVGCGLGTILIKRDRTILSAVIKMSSNSLLSNQLFGISSGTSGCNKHRLVQKQLRIHQFIVRNYENLQIEFATADGEFAQQFAQLLGCNEIPSALSAIQGDYKLIFYPKAQNTTEFLTRIKRPLHHGGCVI
jgi:hypothetical protein